MSQGFKYFIVPFDNVPQDPTCTVWYATWTTQRPEITADSGVLPYAICATPGNDIAGGEDVGSSSRKDPPPPPPIPISPKTASLVDYKQALRISLTRKGI